MSEPFRSEKQFLQLRLLAEQAMIDSPMDGDKLRVGDINNMLHELQVYQIELEMQNVELRRSQQELQVSRDKFSDLYNYSPVGYFTIGETGLILEANLTGATLLNVDLARLINRPFSYYVIKEDEDLFYFHRKELFGSGNRQIVELRIKNGNDSFFYAQLESVVERDDTGKIKQFKTVVSDISKHQLLEKERKQLLKTLEETLAVAESVSRAKTEFLMMMSHEIRTPLNAILGMAEVVLATDLDPKQLHCLSVIDRSGKHLLSLVEDILDITHTVTGQVMVENRPVNLQELIRDTIEVHAYNAENKGLVFNFHIDNDIPEQFYSDAKRLRQVMLNLVGNAVKFTDKGKLALRVSNHDHNTLLFSISDTGIGIPETKLKMIFDPFIQVDSSLTRPHGGIGLGLSLCKRLVDAMNGRIWVESELGKGSTFHFSIPYSLVEQKPDQYNSIPDTTSVNYQAKQIQKTGTALFILLVEDVEENAMVIEAFLDNTPHTLDIAEDGDLAVEKIKSGKRYDLVLMDIQMPRMDGLEATRQIRAWEEEQGCLHTPIMALSAHAMAGDEEKSLTASCDGHITKPISKLKLLEVIEHFSSKNPNKCHD